jgi:hypothetical protein
LLLEQLHFIDMKIPLAIRWCKQPRWCPSHGTETAVGMEHADSRPPATCRRRQLTGKAPEVTACAYWELILEVTSEGHQGLHNPLSVRLCVASLAV